MMLRIPFNRNTRVRLPHPIERRPLLLVAPLLAMALWAGFGPAPRAQTPPSSQPSSPLIARVEGRPITQTDYDRIAFPYFARLREQLGGSISEDIQKFANWSVMNELIRRELLVLEAQRRGIPVTEDDTDRMLQQDPLFQTDGKFDRVKFVQYKISPNSNYLSLLPKLREIAAADKLDSILRAQFTPSSRAVRAEWNQRNARVQFKFLALTARDVSLDPEATPGEREAYYNAHPEEFERKPRARLRYLRIVLPPTGDPDYTGQEAEAMRRGRGLADSLRAGASLDSLAASVGEVNDTGLFDLPAIAIPGIGRVDALNAEIARAAAAVGDSASVVGPVVTPAGVVVGSIVEREAGRLPPLEEVLADVKRRADADKRQKALDADRRAFFEARVEQYRSPRATVARATLAEKNFRARTPSSGSIRRWYADHGRGLFPGLHPEAELPELTDSLKAIVSTRMESEERRKRAHRELDRLASPWQRGRDLAALARSARVVAETLTIVRGAATDSIFPAGFADSLVAGGEPGVVQGPRSFGGVAVVWRIEHRQPDYVPAYASIQPRIEEDFRRDQQAKDEAEARAFFNQSRESYTTKLRWTLETISVPIPPPDSVVVTIEDARGHYDAHRDSYVQEEQVRARHILISSDPLKTPGGQEVAKVRADSLREAIMAGADFAQLANVFSQDPGSAGQGGDLGFFGRGRMVAEFQDTSFALPVGQVSQPVKTTYGYHLIRVEERKEKGWRPFDEVRPDIEQLLKLSRTDSLGRQRAEELSESIARGTVPAAAAAPYGGISTSQPFAKNEAVPGLGFIQGLGDEIETLRPGQWAPQVYKAGNAYVVLRIKERLEPGPAEFEEVKFRVIQDMKNAKRDSLLASRAAELQRAIQAGAKLDSVAALYGGLKDSGPLARNTPFVPYLGNEPQLVERAFALKAGVVSDSVKTAQGWAWIRVEDKTASEGASFERDREALAQEMLLEKYNDWVEQTKKKVRIQIYREDLKEAPPLTRTVTVGG